MKENLYYVYLHITKETNEPFYVGKGGGLTIKSKNRYLSETNRNNYWTNKVKKYGFDIIFLEENLTEEESFIREKYWIKRIGRADLTQGPLVNMTDGGEGAIGRKCSDKTKIKMSEAAKGKTKSEAAKKKMSEYRVGTKLSEETKRKMSLKHIERYKNGFINPMLGRNIKKHIKIIQMDLNNNIIKIWDSQHEAAIFYKCKVGSIIRVCNKNRKTLNGFKWKYYDTE